MAIEKLIRNQHNTTKESNNENPSNFSLVIPPQHQPEVITIDDDNEDTDLSLEITLGGIYDNYVQKESNKNISNVLIGGSDQTRKHVNEVILPVRYGVVQGGPPVPSPSQLALTIDSVSRNPALIRAIGQIREENEKNQFLVGDKLMALSIPHLQNFPSPHLLHEVVHSAVGSPRFVAAYNKIKMELARRQVSEGALASADTQNGSAPETSTVVSRTENKGKGILNVLSETWPPRRIFNPSAGVKIYVDGSMNISKNNTDTSLFKNTRNKSVQEQSAAIMPPLSCGVKENEGVPNSFSLPIIRKKPVEITNPGQPQSKKVKHSDVRSSSNTMRKQMSKVTINIGAGGPKKTEGYLFSQTESEMNIICVCHGMFLSASEFVAHAGIKDVLTDPVKYLSISEQPPLSYRE